MKRRRNPDDLDPRLLAADGAAYFAREALREAQARSQDRSRETLVLMHPRDFLAMAYPAQDEQKTEGVARLMASRTQFRDVPYLLVERPNPKKPLAQVMGHEGRHRARALLAQGVTEMPVLLSTRDIRWSEQGNPAARDYVRVWPTVLRSETKRKSIPFPKSLFWDRVEPNPSRRKNPSDAGAFLRAYEGISRPLGRDGYRRKLGEDVVLSLAEAEDGTVSLDSIESLSARKGAGRAALEQVVSLADKYGVTLKLHPEPFGERAMSRTRLVQFYEGLGFAFSPYDDPDDDFSEMVRVPRRNNGLLASLALVGIGIAAGVYVEEKKGVAARVRQAMKGKGKVAREQFTSLKRGVFEAQPKTSAALTTRAAPVTDATWSVEEEMGGKGNLHTRRIAGLEYVVFERSYGKGRKSILLDVFDASGKPLPRIPGGLGQGGEGWKTVAEAKKAAERHARV